MTGRIDKSPRRSVSTPHSPILTVQGGYYSLCGLLNPSWFLMPRLKILPSILAADMGALREECRRAVDAGADALHLDIMDGHFVPNLSMGPSIVAMIRAAVDVHLDVHLMITQPHQFVDPFIKAGSDTLSIHVEAESNIGECLDEIRQKGVRPGIALNPNTEVDNVLPFGDQVEQVICMSVFPGFGGQAFIPDVLPKIRRIRDALPNVDITVDGGIDVQHGAETVGQGANHLVAGSFLFRADDMATEIQRMRAASVAAMDSTN